jgi:hypothetical protein
VPFLLSDMKHLVTFLLKIILSLNRGKTRQSRKENSCQMCLISDFYPKYIKNSYKSPKEKTTPCFKLEKDLNRKTNEDTQMTNKHRKSCSKSYVVSELPTKTSVKYRYVPV